MLALNDSLSRWVPFLCLKSLGIHQTHSNPEGVGVVWCRVDGGKVETHNTIDTVRVKVTANSLLFAASLRISFFVSLFVSLFLS